MKVEEVDQCSLPNWYTKFKQITIPSVIVKLNDDFVDYLKRDKIVLPNGWDSTENESKTEFETVLNGIKKAIKLFKGGIFPKLNWSAPKDAYYMICEGHTLRCANASEVFYLLKGSEFINHDLFAPYHFCSDIEQKLVDSGPEEVFLCLKKWIDLGEGFEFRCFVNGNILLGITQRDPTRFYETVANNTNQYRDAIVSFFTRYIVTNFPLEAYVFDVFVSGDSSDQVLLIDFNVFSPDITDSGLFSWQQIQELDQERNLETRRTTLPIFSCVETSNQIRRNECEQYARPIEVDNLLSGQSVGLIDYLREAIATQRTAEDSEDDSSGDDEHGAH